MEKIQKYYLPNLIRAVAIGFSLWQLYALSFGRTDPIILRRIFVAWLLVLVYLVQLNKSKKDKKGVLIFNSVAVILSIIIGWYYIEIYERLATRWTMVSPVTNADILFGIIITILILVGVKRRAGWPLVGISLAFVCYGLGYYSIAEIIDQLSLTLYGFFGTPTGVASTIVFAFVLFGSLLNNAKGGEFFISVANKLLGRSRGGPAKVSVVASLLMGSISGSATANVVTTGTVTIPMMKKMGFPPEFAGAVEAVASTGGSIMPPVMGSAAFIMSEMTGIPYITIIGAVLIPALLYYFTLFISIDLRAAKLGLKGLTVTEPMKLNEFITGGICFGIPLVLIFVLLLRGFSPTSAGIYASLALVVLSWINSETRLTPMKILKSLEETAHSMIMIMLACGAAGIVLGMVNMTGVASHAVGTMMVAFQASVLPLLIFTMLICIVLGMGMPNSATYILTAALMAPALINMGVPVLIAHLFIIFFAAMSHITPPVMVAGYAACALAGAEPMKLGLNNLRLAFVAFIVPYFMVYQPALIAQDSVQTVIMAFISACVGVYFIVLSMEGWFKEIQPFVFRIMWLISGLLLLYPGFVTDIAGFVVGLCLILIAFRKARITGALKINAAE
ncbi:MAG: TRAP transporter fused permease subunit [Firmicutes bacterium]|jgi:TRAP transporter 4TM/12TM fusion protein|nr:TRAP transporter fused permease subunit [Bacillota bacterium]